MVHYRKIAEQTGGSSLVVFDLESTMVKPPKAHIVATVHATQATLGLRTLTDDEAWELWRCFDNKRFQELTGWRGIGNEWFTHFYEVEDHDERLVQSEPFMGVVPFVQTLQRCGKQLAVVTNTNSASAQAQISLLGLDGIFCIALAGPPKKPQKPDPFGLALAMDYFHCTPRNTVMYGDSHGDSGMAKAAGNVPFFLFQEGDNGCLVAPLQAEAIFDDWVRLHEVFLQLSGLTV